IIASKRSILLLTHSLHVPQRGTHAPKNFVFRFAHLFRPCARLAHHSRNDSAGTGGRSLLAVHFPINPGSPRRVPLCSKGFCPMRTSFCTPARRDELESAKAAVFIAIFSDDGASPRSTTLPRR